ncbi:MAG TPA: ABC transporter substrate-binding protein [Calidithermus sp.]|jgi:branched-chain amino acid transport system substrate-binding protein|nr:ABC transporter substrate-binding protein [Calidithermus sp.]
MRIDRRTFLRGAAAAAAGAPAVLLRPGWAQTGPIKLGIVEPQSGPVKYVGDNNIAGYRFAVERLNQAGGLLGRQVEIVVADSELKPDVATRRANDLVLGEKVDFLVVNTGSNIAKAVSQVAQQHHKVFFSTGTEAAELTGEEFFPTTFRCCLNTDMHSAQLAVYFARMAPQKYTKFYLLNQDYNFGRAAAEGFKKKFNRIKAPGQQIVGEEYHPLQKTQDFGPYITKIMASGAEVVMTGNWGQDLRLLLQQGASLGWKVKVGNYFLNDPTVLQAVGKAAVGHITADAYLITVDTPENREFLKLWRARYPDAPVGYRYPDLTVGRCVYAVLWLGDVVKRAGSVATDAVIKAWEGARFRTAWGEVEMRACDHQMLTQGYVAEIQEPERIPAAIRYFGTEFPYIGPATLIPREEMTVPPRETGNKRCA